MQPQAPQLTIDQKRAFVNQEFQRRAAGQAPSSAGLGANVTNSPSGANPIPPELQTNPQMPSGGAQGSPTDGTMAAVKQQKGEAQKLTDAMIARSKALTKRGE